MIVSNVGSNMTQVSNTTYTIMLSYNTPVVVFDASNNKLLVTKKKWSATTSKHITKFRAMYPTNMAVEMIDQDTLDSILNSL